MKFSVNRESLIKPLQQMAGVVERRHTVPILANLLLQVNDGRLRVTGTDMEVELIGNTEVAMAEPGEITVPARKIMDICRELPEKADVDMALNSGRLDIHSGRFRSTLSTLPAEDFPVIDQSSAEVTVEMDCKQLKSLLDRTAFAMAQQDVRSFLNGMLVELGEGRVRAVATDGHRLALSEFAEPSLAGAVKQVIVPRKGVIEIQRLLHEEEGKAKLTLGSTLLCVATESFTLTTKLVDGKFPDYQRVIPKEGDKTVIGDRLEMREALVRTAILSNEKYRGIRVSLNEGQLTLSANNPEQEEAEEPVTVQYDGPSLEMGFNVTYLQDVLDAMDSEKVKITLTDANSSALMEVPEQQDSVYVVMPMKL